jgi:hypothetical protein
MQALLGQHRMHTGLQPATQSDEFRPMPHQLPRPGRGDPRLGQPAHPQQISVGQRAGGAAPLFGAKDGDLLVSAALLHDIGYAPDLAMTGFHPLDGARYLVGISASDRVVNRQPLTSGWRRSRLVTVLSTW